MIDYIFRLNLISTAT